MSNRWANNLRKRMADHQEPSPDGLWDDIEQIIKETRRQSVFRREKKILWIKYITTSVAAAILFLLVGYHFFDNTRLDTQFVVEEPLKKQNDLNGDVVNEKSDSEIENVKNKDYQHVLKKQKGTNSTTKKILTEARKIDSSTSTSSSKEEIDCNIENKNTQADSNKKKETQTKKHSITQLRGEDTSFSSSLYINKNAGSNKWDMSLFVSNIPTNSSNNHNGYQSFGTEAPLSCEYLEGFALGDDPYVDILLSNKYKETYTDIEHKQPLTVGLSLRYNLDKRWGIETGLTYTMLSSDLHSGSSNHYYTSKQTLHYMGIPLKVSYNIWENKRFSIYSTGGGQVEKSVSGKLVTNYVINNKKESSKNEKISINQLQWSLNASAGAQINLSEKIGLYVEPGVNYHFKDGSKIETIYKEKPLNFNLQLGFRITID